MNWKMLWAGLCAAALFAQTQQEPRPLMGNQEVVDFYQRVIQLMESTTVAVPDLGRAAAPMIESSKQGLENLRRNPANADLNFAMLSSLRAFLALSDAVPKPFPFPDEGQRQFTELRNDFVRAESHFRALIQLKDRQLRSPDPSNLARYADLDSRIGPPKSDRPRVVFLGDSITDFWRLNEYFPDRDFINRGISGQITGQMLSRTQADVIALNPAAVLVLGGTNDIAHGLSLGAIEDNLTMIADLATAHKIKVILASVLPVSDYHKDVNPNYEMTSNHPPVTIRALNDWIKSFCTRRNFTYLNYYSEVVDAAGFLKPDLADDGLHPNSAGYRIMAPVALKAIDGVLRPPAPQPAQPAKPKKHGLFGR